jgi:hypothetical protein
LLQIQTASLRHFRVAAARPLVYPEVVAFTSATSVIAAPAMQTGLWRVLADLVKSVTWLAL